MDKKKIVFVTGTRADFGKLKPLIQKVEESNYLDAYIFVTGMHMLPRYGTTVHEILKYEFNNVYLYNNLTGTGRMDTTLANTIYGLSCYIDEIEPDLIIVHGDRGEALAGAIVGSFNNIRVGHIEGGEISGTIDGLIRHSITKLSHVHFVTNEKAKNRLLKMGEASNSIFEIGSPEVDFMLSNRLPRLKKVKKIYDIDFRKYGILIYHPVTFERNVFAKNTKEVLSAIVESKLNYIVILPNNDDKNGKVDIEYEKLRHLSNCRVFPSIRFEYFITLLKHSQFIIGNSSSGVREAPTFGVPTINIGSRQSGRNKSESIFNVGENKSEITTIIASILKKKKYFKSTINFGKGKSVEQFMNILKEKSTWQIPLQKVFVEGK